ncbi:phage repressor protein C with HTH and peptisase S24 domain [Dongia mobilis]|uniref:Phage repressor protein C with HTH and peptisase S24 domain n=1 Tax=Dongia mobilis TaxID=578943 RepID=A0A4R6WM80_9PROT|nr:helix-turn-helix transcriptional regulator [Dongia mobilis]TDQ82082.1 phage repressor protein C with HTH and peptisase S24 domain [Dongia mobilis]
MTVPMLQHADVWRGIDRLAAKHGLSASGLARRAGLDPTAFNPSKRITREGRPRWPSTESLSKILAVTSEPFIDFVLLTGAHGGDAVSNGHGGAELAERGAAARGSRIVPVLPLERLATEHFSAAGQPVGAGWGHLDFDGSIGRDAFGIEISGSEFDPVYRDGDTLIASTGAEIRRGDRVVLGLGSGGILIRRVARHDADGYYTESIGPSGRAQFLTNSEVRFAARIIWVSQ